MNDMVEITITEQHTDTLDLSQFNDVRLTLPRNAVVETIIGPRKSLTVAGGPIKRIGKAVDPNDHFGIIGAPQGRPTKHGDGGIVRIIPGLSETGRIDDSSMGTTRHDSPTLAAGHGAATGEVKPALPDEKGGASGGP